MDIKRDGVHRLHALLWILNGFKDRHRSTTRRWRTEIWRSFAGGFSSGANVCFVSFIGCVCLLCVSSIGASKRPSIDPLDLLDVSCHGVPCLERAMHSLYALVRSDDEAIRLYFVCVIAF